MAPSVKTVRPSVLRRKRKRGSKRGGGAPRRSYRAGLTGRKYSGVPLAFQAFNRVKTEAETEGRDTFSWNGNLYHRHEWSNGVPVWKRG